MYWHGYKVHLEFYKQFVSSRVGEIQRNSDPKQWRHIPSESNVADDVSRGIAVQELNKRWLQGPEFLRMPLNDWAQDKWEPDDKEVSKEARKLVCTLEAAECPIDAKKYSSWRKLIRITAYVLKFVKRIRMKKKKTEEILEDNSNCLGPRELQEAERYWIQNAQKDLYKRIQKGELTTLSPFTDSEGIIRVGGRADKATVRMSENILRCYPTTIGYPSLLLASHTVLVTMESQLQQQKLDETIGLYEDMILQSQ